MTGLLVLGLGARSATPAADVEAGVSAALVQAGVLPAAITVLATLDRRAAEPGPRALAERHGWRIVGYTAEELAAVDVPHPSETVARRSGTASVAEAAALLAAGPGASLVLPKRVVGGITVAMALSRS